MQMELAMGCWVDKLDFDKMFRKVIPAISHMEDRYDPKSGEKVKPIRVYDRYAREEWVVDGKTYDTVDSAFSAVAETLLSECAIVDDRDTNDVCFSDVHFSYDCISLDEIMKYSENLKKFQQILKEKYNLKSVIAVRTVCA